MSHISSLVIWTTVVIGFTYLLEFPLSPMITGQAVKSLDIFTPLKLIWGSWD